MSIYGIGIGENFLSQLVTGFLTRHPDPVERARIRIIANSSRTAFNLEREFLAQSGFSPKIDTLDRFVESQRTWPAPPTALSEIEQVLDVAKLLASVDLPFVGGSQNQIFELSYHLIDLLNACAEHQKSPADLLALELTEYSEHWQMNAALFNILLEYWQGNQHNISNVIKLNEIKRLGEHWASHPPQNPHYVVASTGSRLQMREFMALVLHQNEGGIILPSFDFAPHKYLNEDHPQYGMQDLLSWLGARGHTRNVKRWSGEDTPIAPFIHRAMAPPPYTQTWLEELNETRSELDAANLELSTIFAPTPQDEINALTAAIYQARQQGKTVQLVSHDRVLVRRLLPRLDDLDIHYDDSAGRPLHLTPSAIFASLALDAFGDSHVIRAVAFMEHPFTQRAKDRANHMKNLRQYEREVLRGAMNSEAWRADLSDEKYAPLRDWAESWSRFFTAQLSEALPLQDWLGWHLKALKWASGIEEKWNELGGEIYGDLDIFTLMETLKDTANYPHHLSFSEYQALWKSWLARTGSVIERPDEDAPVKILGQLEMRAEMADLVILAALNEGQWPSAHLPDMWLNRDMRRKLDLETPERFIGLSAHDFITGFSAKELVLARAVKAGDVPNIESRFLTRLRVLIEGAHPEYFKAAKARGDAWIADGQELDRPCAYQAFEQRPAISLPPDLRPNGYSPTGIEALLRNPYRAYAERSLHLRELSPMGGEFGAAELGTVIHKAFELQSKAAGAPPEPLDEIAYYAAVDDAMGQYALEGMDRFDVEGIMQTLAPVFIAEENSRREWAQNLQTENEMKAKFGDPTQEMTITARFDRLDQNGLGSWRLYDYKTGASSPYSAKEINPDAAVQIPITALVVRENLGDEADEIGVIRYKGDAAGSFASFKNFTLEGFAEEFNQFLENYFDPEFEFAAGYKANGFDGAFEHLARFGEWLEGDAPETIEVAS